MNEPQNDAESNAAPSGPKPPVGDGVPVNQQIETDHPAEIPDKAFNGHRTNPIQWLNELWKNDPDRVIELALAAAIVIFSFCQLVVTVVNNRSTSAQVSKLIAAANQIQAAAGSFSQSAGQINTGITNAVTQLGIEAGAATIQAGASRTLAGVTADQWTANRELIESQRASLNISLGRVLNPITFHDGAPSIAFSILIQNTGALKATHVLVRFKPYYSLWGNDIFTEPLQKQRDYCAANPPPSPDWGQKDGRRVNLKGLRDWTFTVEPHEASEQQLNFGMAKPTNTEIIKWPPAEVIQKNPSLPVTDRVFPIVVGCVDYQSGAMPERHQTGFIFEVQEAFSDPTNANAAPTIVHYGVDLPRERVIITQFFFGQGKRY